MATSTNAITPSTTGEIEAVLSVCWILSIDPKRDDRSPACRRSKKLSGSRSRCRYYEPTGKRAGLERRREADDPGAGARQRICPDQQWQDCSRLEEHLQTARHGTVNLFAALEVATGVIRGKTTQTKKRVDFQAFMTDLVAKQPPDREIHVILDNLSTHKKNDRWLAAHPNVTFHFTPTSASWLNQVEIWFGIFSRKALAGASFASVAQLVQAIRDFTEAYNRNAAPFVWRKREVKGAQLRNTIVNLRN